MNIWQQALETKLPYRMTRRQVETLIFAVIAFLFLTALAVSLWGQAPTPTPYQPTESQAKDLRIAQLTVQNANLQFQQAQLQLQSAFQQLQAAGKKIADDNAADAKLHWPKTVEYDINSGTFVDHPKPAADDKKDVKP